METVENQTGKPPATNPFAAWENTSLKTQQSIVAIAVAVVSSLAVATVLQVDLNDGSPIWFQLMAVLGTAIAASTTTFTLQQITINRINRSREYLQKFLDNWSIEEESVSPGLELQKEWKEIAVSLHQIKEEIIARIYDWQQKVAAAENETDRLQQQLREFVDNREPNGNGEVEAARTAKTQREQRLDPPGDILEFIEQLDTRGEELDLDLFIGSSTPQEIQERHDLLQYRELWLQAILAETQKELEFLSRIDRQAKQQSTN